MCEYSISIFASTRPYCGWKNGQGSFPCILLLAAISHVSASASLSYPMGPKRLYALTDDGMMTAF